MTTQPPIPPPPAARLAVTILNEALAADRAAVSAIVMKRVPCNADLGDHPTIQVTREPRTQACSVSVLGLLNGICGVIPSGPRKDWGWVTAVTDGPRVLRFELTDPNGEG
jgi:hypothetical protein